MHILYTVFSIGFKTKSREHPFVLTLFFPYHLFALHCKEALHNCDFKKLNCFYFVAVLLPSCLARSDPRIVPSQGGVGTIISITKHVQDWMLGCGSPVD